MSAFMRRMAAISKKELRQLSRDRGTFAMVVMIPIIQLLLFGYAINTDVRHIHAAVVDQSQSVFSRQIIAQIQASQVLDFVISVSSPQEMDALIRDGQVSVGLFIPRDAQRRLGQVQKRVAQITVDGSDPVIAGAIAQLRHMPLSLPEHQTAHSAGQLLATRILYNPEKRSAVNVVPGLIGVILTLTMILFTAIAIVREKEHGTLELLISTPISTLELMLGKVLPYIAIGLIQAGLILALGYWIFQVPVNGTLIDVLLAVLLFIAASLTLGLVISTIAKTQMQAMQMTIFIFMPSMLLTGFMFPYDGMPLPAQWIAQTLPLTHFLRIIRGIVLRGAELSNMMSEVYFLLIFTAISLSIAVLRFNKRLD
jgi:ABC-2 type transport system permease protein